MNMIKDFLLILAFISVSVISQTNLSGKIGGMTFEKTGNPYIITENLTIPSGKKIVVKEGCIFLFKPFSGLIVEGSIEVAGNRESPVIFTSIHDSLFNSDAIQAPEPFDWNGITISVQARQVNFSHISLSYSVYGIKSQTTELKINSSIFSNNGQFHFTINDVIQMVNDFEPYSYGIEIENPDTLVSIKTQSFKKTVTIISFVCSAGSFAAMGISLKMMSVYENKYHNSESQEQRNNNINKATSFRNTAIASGATGLSLFTLGLILAISDKRMKSDASFELSINQGCINGFCATVNF